MNDPLVPRSTADRRRMLVRLCVPATLTLMAEPLLGVVDAAIAGRLGAVELGALGLATSLLGGLTWVFNFLVFGTTSTVAQALGRADAADAGRRVAHAGLVAAVLGGAAAVLVAVLARPVVQLSGAVPELVEPAVPYLQVRALGVPFMLVAFVGHGAFRGAGDTRRPLLVIAVANLVNLALNLMLVFGFGWGLAGIAAATVAAEVITACWLALMGRARLGFPLSGHGLPGRAEVLELATTSRDLFIRTASLVGSVAVISAAAARVGAETSAAHMVMWQVYLLLSFFLDGLAVAAQTIMGRAAGAGAREVVRATVHDSLRWGLGVGVVLAAGLLAGQPVLVAAFTDDPGVSATVATSWWLPSLLAPLHALVFILDGLLMGVQDYAFIRTWTATGSVLGAATAQVCVSLGGGLLSLWVCYEIVMLLRGVPMLLRSRDLHRR